MPGNSNLDRGGGKRNGAGLGIGIGGGENADTGEGFGDGQIGAHRGPGGCLGGRREGSANEGGARIFSCQLNDF